MTPVSGFRIHYDADWELLSTPASENQASESEGEIVRSYRRLYKSRQVYGGPGKSDAALSEPASIDEYIYLLITADTTARADAIASIVMAHINENIHEGGNPTNVSFTCPNEECSYFIRMQGSGM